MFRKVLFLLFSFVLFLPFNLAQEDWESLEGKWKGTLKVGGGEMEIIITFLQKEAMPKATIDIPPQGVKAVPLSQAHYIHPEIFLELSSPNGSATFNGKRQENQISGDFTQAGFKGVFSLEKVDLEAEAKKRAALPYLEEEVSIPVAPEVVLAGTLTLPKKVASPPVVIMITGSGPQNRDENVFGFSVFATIAHYLGSQGIAVLRTDDRGIGESTGTLRGASILDFTNDVKEIIAFLKKRKDIDLEKIGLFGHSEGGIVAPLVATQSPDVSFVIMMAGTAVRGDRIISTQARALWEQQNLSEEEMSFYQSLQEEVFQAVRTGEGWNEVAVKIRMQLEVELSKLPEAQKKSIPNPQQHIDRLLQARLQAAQSEWFKHFITYDPAMTLAKIKCPLLALFGELDLQVLPELNKQNLEKTLEQNENIDCTIKVFPKANHLFQDAITGSPEEYPTLEKAFTADFLPTVSSWIQEKTSK